MAKTSSHSSARFRASPPRACARIDARANEASSLDDASFARARTRRRRVTTPRSRARRFARTPEAETRGNARKNAMTFSPLSVLLHPISPASASPSPRVGFKDDERTNPARLFSSDGARGRGVVE